MPKQFDDYWTRLCRATPQLDTMYPNDCVIKMKITAFKHAIAKAYRAGADDILKSAQSSFDGGDLTDFLGGLFQQKDE